MQKNRIRFQLRTLLLASALIAVALGVLRSEIVGDLQTEADTNDIVMCAGSSPSVSFFCLTPQDAQKVFGNFDRHQFIALATEHVRVTYPDAADAMRSATATTGTHQNICFIQYDFPRWGRYRLDLPRFCYTHDVNDKVARSRNAAICKSFAAAAQSMALDQAICDKNTFFCDSSSF